MLCGSPKKQSRTSSIVQFIFFFWPFDILSLVVIVSSFRVTEENLVFETLQSGPYSFLNVSSALKGTHFYILFIGRDEHVD